jgi:hypothetical protein
VLSETLNEGLLPSGRINILCENSLPWDVPRKGPVCQFDQVINVRAISGVRDGINVSAVMGVHLRIRRSILDAVMHVD